MNMLHWSEFPWNNNSKNLDLQRIEMYPTLNGCELFISKETNITSASVEEGFCWMFVGRGWDHRCCQLVKYNEGRHCAASSLNISPHARVLSSPSPQDDTEKPVLSILALCGTGTVEFWTVNKRLFILVMNGRPWPEMSFNPTNQNLRQPAGE